jgi:hypothetical protein
MRREGWERLLNEHIEKPARFQWGQNDCALWCADWVRKATGQDFASHWRGRYSSEDELRELLLEHGYEAAEDIASDVLPEMHPAFAQRGDIVLHPQGCLGICNGILSYFLTADGVTTIKTANCLRAWKVR